VKKIVAAFILLVFLFNSMGYYFLFEVNKALVKREMAGRMKRSEFSLSVLTIENPGTNPEFRRIEKKEFIYRGKMYDVIREVRKGSCSVFYCIHDEKEQNLLAGFKKVSHSKLSQFLADHLIKNALPVSEKMAALPMEGRIRYPLLKNNTCSTDQLPFTPPPELSL